LSHCAFENNFFWIQFVFFLTGMKKKLNYFSTKSQSCKLICCSFKARNFSITLQSQILFQWQDVFRHTKPLHPCINCSLSYKSQKKMKSTQYSCHNYVLFHQNNSQTAVALWYLAHVIGWKTEIKYLKHNTPTLKCIVCTYNSHQWVNPLMSTVAIWVQL